jgi:hypothetical protein
MKRNPSQHEAKAIGLLPGETLLMSFHSHWVSLVPGFFVFIISIALAILFISVSYNATDYSFTPSLAFTGGLLILSTGILFFVKNILNWYYRIYTITSNRIIRFQMLRFFRHENKEIVGDLVQIIQVHEPSFIGTLLNYSNIEFGNKELGQDMKFIIHWCPNPQAVLRAINYTSNT